MRTIFGCGSSKFRYCHVMWYGFCSGNNTFINRLCGWHFRGIALEQWSVGPLGWCPLFGRQTGPLPPTTGSHCWHNSGHWTSIASGAYNSALLMYRIYNRAVLSRNCSNVPHLKHGSCFCTTAIKWWAATWKLAYVGLSTRVVLTFCVWSGLFFESFVHKAHCKTPRCQSHQGNHKF